MAELDVTDLLLDPDFADSFTVVRRVGTVDNTGVLQIANTYLNGIIGVVQPASGRTLQLKPDLANVEGVIEVWALFNFQLDSSQLKADLIIWCGKTYIVNSSVQDFQNYGSGYTRVVATLHKTAGDTSPAEAS